MVALRVGGVEVVASMRAWRLEPLPEMRTRRRGVDGEDITGDGGNSYGEGGGRVTRCELQELIIAELSCGRFVW